MNASGNRLTHFEIWTLVLEGIGVLLVIGTLTFGFYQSGQIATQFKLSYRDRKTSLLEKLDLIFVEHPEIRPHFYEGVPIAPGNAHYQLALAVAETHLDVFSQILGDLEYFHVDDDSPTGTSRRWMRDMFKRSPILRQRLRADQRWYNYKSIEKKLNIRICDEMQQDPLELWKAPEL